MNAFENIKIGDTLLILPLQQGLVPLITVVTDLTKLFIITSHGKFYRGSGFSYSNRSDGNFTSLYGQYLKIPTVKDLEEAKETRKRHTLVKTIKRLTQTALLHGLETPKLEELCLLLQKNYEGA